MSRALLTLVATAALACTVVTDFDEARWQETGREACSDGVDNDEDGAVDCAQASCADQANCRCEPASVTPVGCARDEGCYLARRDDEESYAFCSEAGSGTQGASCGDSADCGAGFTCVARGSGDSVCARQCNRTTGAQCLDHDDTTCRPLGSGYTIDGVDYGVCL